MTCSCARSTIRCWRRWRTRPASISPRLAERGDRLAFTTDSYVVDPLFFPGGDIGKLAVCGTINDLAVGGAVPLYLSCAVIIEEGVRGRSAAPDRRIHGRDGARGRGRDRHRRHQGRAQGACDQVVHHHRRHRRDPDGSGTGRRAGAARRRVLVNGVLGDHGAAILCARGDLRWRRRSKAIARRCMG